MKFSSLRAVVCWFLMLSALVPREGVSAQNPLTLSIQIHSNQAAITITGTDGSPLELQYLDTLSVSNNWRRLAYMEPLQNPFTWVDPAPLGSRRFYRIARAATNMVFLPAGSFQMGNSFPEGYADERPVHPVFISGFYIDRYEITFGAWNVIRTWGTNHGYRFVETGAGVATNHPAHSMTWLDAVKWCNARSEHDGLTPVYFADPAFTQLLRTNSGTPYVKWSANGYRLPTEAEWEKAARGNVSSNRFSWPGANVITHLLANYYSDSGYSYDTSATRGYHPDFDDGLTPFTAPVGSFAPSGYGLYDMTGNVNEWCWDWFNSEYYGTAPATQNDPRGPDSSAIYRVVRGGSWQNSAIACRVAYRIQGYPTSPSYNCGFRCVRGPY